MTENQGPLRAIPDFVAAWVRAAGHDPADVDEYTLVCDDGVVTGCSVRLRPRIETVDITIMLPGGPPDDPDRCAFCGEEGKFEDGLRCKVCAEEQDGP